MSIGQSTTDDLFPEMKLKWRLENVNLNACLLEKLSARVHPTYRLRNVVRGIEKFGFYNEEGRWHLRFEHMNFRIFQKAS